MTVLMADSTSEPRGRGQAGGMAPGGALLTSWGMQLPEQIPPMGEVIPSWNGDDVLTRRQPHVSQHSNEILKCNHGCFMFHTIFW